MHVYPTVSARLDAVKHMLRTNRKWAMRALELIYQHQTDEEQRTDRTTAHNEVGFGAFDAELLSSYAIQLMAWKNKKGAPRYYSPFSDSQWKILHKNIAKYAGQLLRITDLSVTLQVKRSKKLKNEAPLSSAHQTNAPSAPLQLTTHEVTSQSCLFS